MKIVLLLLLSAVGYGQINSDSTFVADKEVVGIEDTALVAKKESVNAHENFWSDGVYYDIQTAIKNSWDVKKLMLHITDEREAQILKDSLKMLTNLESLSISSFEVFELPEDISLNKKLSYISIKSTQITSLPEDIVNLENLVRLELHVSDKFEALPPNFGRLTNLKRLKIVGGSFKEFDPELFGLESLLFLELKQNSIAFIPEGINKLSKLRVLKLSDSEITEVPSGLSELSKLEQLDLSSNKITNIPNSIGRLGSLRRLDLHENELLVTPSGLFQLSKLEKLDLSSNKLTNISNSIGNLESLRELDLHENELLVIPGGLFELSKLELLDLGSNKLTYISDSIANLVSLKGLDIHENELVSMPVTLCLCRDLRKVYVTYGRFGELKKSIKNIERTSQGKFRIYNSRKTSKSTYDNHIVSDKHLYMNLTKEYVEAFRRELWLQDRHGDNRR